MDPSRARLLARTVARYLLFTLLGLLLLDRVTGMGTLLSFLSLAGVTAVLFLLLAVDSLLNTTQAASSRQRASAWTWLGDDRWEQTIVVGLVIVGLVLRVYALGEQSFWFDEAITTNAAISFLEYGRPVFPSGYTYWRAFTHTLTVSASLLIFDTSEWAARFPSVLFGGGSILATYWLGREVGGRRVGLLAAGLLTFATWEIAWSRQARMYQLFQFLYLLAVVLLLRIERHGLENKRRLGTLVVVVALAAATHSIGYILLPVVVVFLSLTAVLDNTVTRRTAGLIIGVAVALTVLFEFVGPGVTGAVETVTATDVNYWDAYISWGASEFHAFFYLAVVGATLTAYTGAYRAGLLCGLAVLPPAVVLSFSTQLFATRYLYFVLPFLFVWATVVFVFVFDLLAESLPPIHLLRLNSAQRRAIGSIGLVCLLTLGGGFTVVPQQDYQLGVNAPQPDFASAYEHINANRGADDVVVAGWTAPGVYYAGGVNYWLAHDLTGTGGEYTVSGDERYSGATPITSADELATVLAEEEQVWIVLDQAAYFRQSERTQRLLSNETQVDHRAAGIVVYKQT